MLILEPIIDKTFLEQKISIDSALLHGRTLISLYRREMPNLIYFRLPLIMDELYARAMGKAVLSKLDPDEVSNIIEEIQLKKLTPKTLLDKEEILKNIELTRNRGYSINNEEYVEGLICLGAPLMNFRNNTVVGAVSLDFPTSEYTLDSIKQNFLGVLTKLASELSEAVTSAEI